MMEGEGEERVDIYVTSIVGLMTKQALVRIKLGPTEATLPAADARKVALDILSAADASESDLALVRFVMEKMEGGMDEAGVFLQQVREFREAKEPS